MHKNLETYLEEISHFLSGPVEREEILNEIRSHILERAEQEGRPATEAALDKAIAAYGRPQRVAESYVEDKTIIAPAYRRFLFRYTSLLFAVHLAFTALAVIFTRSFTVFPFLFVPRLSFFSAILYLPMAFLADFGAVSLFLYIVTRSGREIRLPWPKFGSDLKEMESRPVKFLTGRLAALAGAAILLAVTSWAIGLVARHHTLFLINLNPERPLFMPAPGRILSLIVLVMLGALTITLLAKAFTGSRKASCWVNAAADAVSLVLLGGLFSHPYSQLFAVRMPDRLQSWLRPTLSITLLVLALVIAYDLIVNLARLRHYKSDVRR